MNRPNITSRITVWIPSEFSSLWIDIKQTSKCTVALGIQSLLAHHKSWIWYVAAQARHTKHHGNIWKKNLFIDGGFFLSVVPANYTRWMTEWHQLSLLRKTETVRKWFAPGNSLPAIRRSKRLAKGSALTLHHSQLARQLCTENTSSCWSKTTFPHCIQAIDSAVSAQKVFWK